MTNSWRFRMLVGTACLLFGLAITWACSDFLNTPAQGTLDVNALSNKAGVEGSLIAAYRSLDCNNATNGNWGCAASNWPFGSITSDDAYKGSEATDQPQATQLELYAWSSDQAQQYLDRKWASMYEGVVRANATIRLLQAVSQSKPGEISHADSMGIMGEALFLRAHYHFELWRMWGNVPYYFETDQDSRKPNNTNAAQGADSVAKLILADLQAAAALLPATPRNGEKGRVTSWTARAYKGRVLVYTHQYAAAVAAIDSIVTDPKNPYGLEVSFDRVWTGFHQYADGPETILAYQASVNDGEPNGNNSNYGERLNLPHSGSPFKCCGFHQPSQNLANFYAVDGVTGLPKQFVDSVNWNNRDSIWWASPTDTVDPRMDWTIGRYNAPYKDWGLETPCFSPCNAGWIRAPGYGGPYSPKKNAQEKASGAVSKVGWQPEQENGVHIHIFRYADLLLLDAEAKVETSDLVGSFNIVNQIRTRAGKAAQGCGDGATDPVLVAKYPKCSGDSRLAVPINDSTIGWATYKVSPYPGAAFPDQATARRAVRIERRLELAMEGQRLFDLRRYGGPYAASVMTAYLVKEDTPLRRQYKSAQTPYATPLNDLYPIPTVEIDLSVVGGVKRLNQNPGW
ncbi:MAG TPA: RagB/SusD family nutrient uptake outer membrane protein [Gemmatimonadales bacterium]|nr:RagB/SusD family nutrient uptake outer membrane protein [Gemmatimonadales bacterium]